MTVTRNQRAFLKGDPGWGVVLGSCHCNFRTYIDKEDYYKCGYLHTGQKETSECSRANCPHKIRKSKMLPGEYEEWRKTHEIYHDPENDPVQEVCKVCNINKVERPVQMCGKCYRILRSKL